MVEIRNWNHCERLSCVAGEALEQGQVIKLTNVSGVLTAVKATAVADIAANGVLIAYWINPRDTAVAFNGGADGLGFTVLASTDKDANHYIPSGARMLAIGGGAVVRYYEESLDDDFATTLPVLATVVGVSSTTSKLCLTNAADVITGLETVGRVIEADAVSVTVLLAR